MKLFFVISSLLVLASCGQVKNIMDGTEKLPGQIQETNAGMAKTNEAIRIQKMGVAMEIMTNPKNRITMTPIPSDMMAGAKIFGEAANAEEAMKFFRNYLVKINGEQFDGEKLVADPDAPPGADPVPNPEYASFLKGKEADLVMLYIVAGNLPEKLVNQLIETESEQGAYRNVLFQVLKMRSTYYHDLMVHAAMLDGDNKLETLGQIENVIDYNEKVDFICSLPFANQIALQITGFEEAANEKLSKPLDREIALANWKQIKAKAESDFKAQSFYTDPAKNEAALSEYNLRHKELLKKIQQKIDNLI